MKTPRPRHPIHPALVHFPIACWTMATAADLLSLQLGQPAWWFAGVMLVVGCFMAMPALLAGLIEMTQVPEGPALRDVYFHMAAMLTAFTLYGLSLLLRVHGWQFEAPGSLALTCSFLAFLAMAIGGWQGGRLVYHHGIGRSTPCD